MVPPISTTQCGPGICVMVARASGGRCVSSLTRVSTAARGRASGLQELKQRALCGVQLLVRREQRATQRLAAGP
jgi:hypothetical protein